MYCTCWSVLRAEERNEGGDTYILTNDAITMDRRFMLAAYSDFNIYFNLPTCATCATDLFSYWNILVIRKFT